MDEIKAKRRKDRIAVVNKWRWLFCVWARTVGPSWMPPPLIFFPQGRILQTPRPCPASSISSGRWLFINFKLVRQNHMRELEWGRPFFFPFGKILFSSFEFFHSCLNSHRLLSNFTRLYYLPLNLVFFILFKVIYCPESTLTFYVRSVWLM